MSLSSLPNEILHQICPKLDIRDLKAWRLVSRHFAAVGLLHFPREVTLIDTLEGIARARAIAENSVLGKRVLDLRVSIQMRSPQELVDARSYIAHFPKELSNETKLAAFEKFQKQDTESHSIRFGQIVIDLFPKLSSLERVLFFDHRYSETVADSLDYWGIVEESPMQNRSLIFKKADGSWRVYATHLLSTVLSAMDHIKQQQPERTFSISYPFVPAGLDEHRLWTYQDGFDSLKALTLNSCELMRSASRHSANEQRHNDRHQGTPPLARFIASARYLEDLSVDVYGEDSRNILYSKMLWPDLIELGLWNIILESDHMLKFFKRHRTTLDIVYLHDSPLQHRGVRASWLPFLRTITEASPDKFQVFEVSDLPPHDPISPAKWVEDHPDNLPPYRSIEYLMTGENTSYTDEGDEITHHYDWNTVTWERVRTDAQALSVGHVLGDILLSRTASEMMEEDG